MTHYASYAPDTLERPDSWREKAICRAYPNLFMPRGKESDGDTDKAKEVCNACPVREACLTSAMNEEAGQDHKARAGVRGALTPAERAAIDRKARRHRAQPDEPTARAVGGQVRYTSVAHALAARATVEDGHTLWTDSPHFTIDGIRYVARRAAFQEDHGRPPVGPVHTVCGRPGCITHLNDQQIRERCGTPAGYRRHHANGEHACRDCKNANADADRRLRNTGTTKAKATA